MKIINIIKKLAKADSKFLKKVMMKNDFGPNSNKRKYYTFPNNDLDIPRNNDQNSFGFGITRRREPILLSNRKIDEARNTAATPINNPCNIRPKKQTSEEIQFLQLTNKGRKIVRLLMNTHLTLNFIRIISAEKQFDISLFGNKGMLCSLYKHHSDIWNSLVNRTHELTAHLKGDEGYEVLKSYISIATKGYDPGGFMEPAEEAEQRPYSQLAQIELRI